MLKGITATVSADSSCHSLCNNFLDSVVPTIGNDFVGARNAPKNLKQKTFLFLSHSIPSYYDSHSNRVKGLIIKVMAAYL